AWGPFPERALPVAEEVAGVAERFDFAVRTWDLGQIDAWPRRSPGIILIDPSLMARDESASALREAVRDLPPWILPLVVIGSAPSESPAAWARAANDLLRQAGALHTGAARGAALGVASGENLDRIVRDLLAEAERQFVRRLPPLLPGRP